MANWNHWNPLAGASNVGLGIGNPLNSVYNINTQTYHPLQNTGISQLGSMAQQSTAAQQQQLYNQMMGARLGTWTKRYMIDGKPMDFKEFCDTIYPDDCAEKTHLILKFGGKEND